MRFRTGKNQNFAFIDPHDHENDYVNSVTILDGLNFTLEEEYHVVHHQVRNT